MVQTYAVADRDCPQKVDCHNCNDKLILPKKEHHTEELWNHWREKNHKVVHPDTLKMVHQDLHKEQMSNSVEFVEAWQQISARENYQLNLRSTMKENLKKKNTINDYFLKRWTKKEKEKLIMNRVFKWKQKV